MIDSIVGLAILLIIIAALNYFGAQEIENSKVDLITTIQSAASSSNGQLVVSQRDLTFAKKYSLDTIDAQSWTQISAKCFHFTTRASEGSVRLTGDSLVEFTQTIALKVYAQCKPMQTCDVYDRESCCVDCTISFGKKLE
jgi:Flp pilus assembly protein CpaB